MCYSPGGRDAADNSSHIKTPDIHHIEKVSEYEYFGLWWDRNITFKFHISTLVFKVMTENWIFTQKWKQVSHLQQETHYWGSLHVHPRLEWHYLWTCLCLRSQPTTLCLSIRAESYYRWQLLYTSLHWFLFIYKALNGDLPRVTFLLHWFSSHYSTHSTDWITPWVPHDAHVNFGGTAFSFCIAHT